MLEFFVAEQGHGVSDQGDEQQGEVAAREQHKHHHHDLGIVGIVGQAAGVGGKPARRDGGHGMAHRVEPTHVARVEQNDFQQGEESVQAPQPFGGVHGAGRELVVVDAVHLGDEQLHAACAEEGKEGHRKDDNGQAAKPLGHAAPQQDVFWNGLEMGERAGAGGGKAGKGLKKGVGEVGDAFAEQKRQAAEHGKHDPRKQDGDDAFAEIEPLPFPPSGREE